MKEPRRLSQSGGVSQRLLDSASLDVPGLAARRHAAALAATASSFAHTSSNRSASANTSGRARHPGKTLVTWVVVGAAASVALGLLGSRLLGTGSAPHGAAPLATLSTLPAPLVRSPDIAAEPTAPALSPGRASPGEVGAIEAARAALARGDAEGALARLNDYDSSHPNGQLEGESMALRIQALSQSGKTTEARALADEFRAKYPDRLLPGR